MPVEEVKKSKKDIYAIGLKEEKELFLSTSDLYCMKDFTAYRKKEGLLIRKTVYFQE
jgi:hypothetical protein